MLCCGKDMVQIQGALPYVNVFLRFLYKILGCSFILVIQFRLFFRLLFNTKELPCYI